MQPCSHVVMWFRVQLSLISPLKEQLSPTDQFQRRCFLLFLFFDNNISKSITGLSVTFYDLLWGLLLYCRFLGSFQWIVLHVPFLRLHHCNSTQTNPVFCVGARVRSGYDHADITTVHEERASIQAVSAVCDGGKMTEANF